MTSQESIHVGDNWSQDRWIPAADLRRTAAFSSSTVIEAAQAVHPEISKIPTSW